MTRTPDWNWSAKELASLVHDDMMEAHRGVAVAGESTLVAFGNDGIGGDSRSQAEVAAVRDFLLKEAVGVELAYAESDGVTWVMLISAVCSDVEQLAAELDNVVWTAWLEGATGDSAMLVRQFQTNVAQGVIDEFLLEMEDIVSVA